MVNTPAPSPLSASAFYRMHITLLFIKTHSLLDPPVRDLATEIQGLLHLLPQLSMTGNNTKAECSHYWALPTHYMTAFCNHALVTKERMASSLDYNKELQEFWTADPGNRVFSFRKDTFSVQFAGSSFCHPVYDNKHMLKVEQHPTASALILISKRQPLLSYCSKTGWKTAPTLFRKLALTTRMFALYWEKCTTCHSSTSKAKHYPCQKQHGAYAS